MKNKVIAQLFKELIDKKAQMGDMIIRNMLRKEHLPFNPTELEQAGYVMVIEKRNNKTVYKLAKIINIHTLTETIKEKADDSISITLDIDIKKEVLA